jgi:hypothetical protein
VPSLQFLASSSTAERFAHCGCYRRGQTSLLGGPPDLATMRLECWMRGAPAGSHQAGTILATKDSVPSRWAVGDQVRSRPPMTHVDCCCYGIRCIVLCLTATRLPKIRRPNLVPTDHVGLMAADGLSWRHPVDHGRRGAAPSWWSPCGAAAAGPIRRLSSARRPDLHVPQPLLLVSRPPSSSYHLTSTAGACSPA